MIETEAQLQGCRLEPGQEFHFACHPGLACFNTCCAHKRLPVLPYDLLRLRRGLQMDSQAVLERFKQAEVVWCQEEPRNMGAWHFIEPYLEWVLNQVGSAHKRPRYAGRAAAAATATGLMSKHLQQLKALLDEALG